ncbi:MAG: SOS response-associated peptidase [Planctomycetes bacterium]|nr:SOS response-associated peptidase [Planctomycetota bacterium]
MCGRFANAESIPATAVRWSAALADGLADWSPSDDIRPTQRVPVLLEGPADRPRRLGLMVWGWARDFAASGNLINARAEEMVSKKTFTEAVQRRRCLIPATSWFEWQANPSNPKAKMTKFRLAPSLDGPWSLAGLWEPIPGQKAAALVVITVAADPSVQAVHSRMPGIVGLDAASAWLAGPVEAALALLRPVPSTASLA